MTCKETGKPVSFFYFYAEGGDNMIIVYNRKDGKIIGYYDTSSDVYADYPDAFIHGTKAYVDEE